MWGCRKAVKSLPGGDSWRYGGWRDLQASAGSKGLAPCQCRGAHLEYIYNHISFVGVHLHNTVKSFLQTANQIFTQKLWLKHSVKVLHCQITLTTHKYDYVRLKQGSDSRFRAIRAYNHKVSALRQCQIHYAVDTRLHTKAHARADGCLWQQDRTPFGVVYLLCQAAESHQAAIGSIKHVAGGNFTVDHA